MPTDASREDLVFTDNLCGRALTFHTTWGLFSPRRVDGGTRLLLEHLELDGCRRALDLGCGYGALGLAIAKRCPDAEVHLVDRDFLAVEYAEKNAATNQLDNCRVYLSHGLREVPPESSFDRIVANLPANVGKEMLSILVADARARLAPGGQLWVVTIEGLRKFIRRHFEQVFDNYDKVKQRRGHSVARATRR